MSTLLLRLTGPMQSWGTQSRFTIRDSDREPSKSGVIGLLCAALGRPRHQPVQDLAALKMGVRVDREGHVARDYQTAGGQYMKIYGKRKSGVARAGASDAPGTVVSERFYLADACFLVGLEGETTLLDRLQEALTTPVWQCYLGRKSYVPSEPISLPDGLGDTELEQRLVDYPWLSAPRWENEDIPATLRVVLDATNGDGDAVRSDVPTSFAARTFDTRMIRTTWIARPQEEA